MAIANSLQKVNKQEQEIKYDANGETVKLTANLVRNYLVSGSKNDITNEEIMMFISLCKFQHLNPFVRDAYLIKYGSKNPATMVVGKDVLLKRAMRSEKYGGHTAGIIVRTQAGALEEREGTFYLSEEELVGGWARVIIKGYSVPIYASASMREYMGRKSDGTPNGQWSSKPATMIRKVALAQALREAFPEEMSALYDQAEIKEVSDITLDATPVNAPVDASDIVEVKEPVQSVATPVGGVSGGQETIDNIMFGSQAASLVGEPPFEVK